MKKRLPTLRKIDYKKKKHIYKLKDSRKKRRKAIDEGIKYETKKKNRTEKEAALSKKARFNLLRMYRKNKNPKECKVLTEDMRYIDKKYNLGKTTDICNKKGGGKKLPIKKNIDNKTLKICSINPMTGFYRNGYCMAGIDDKGTHTVCAKMDKSF